jgi:hypothetical protein
MRFGAWNGTVEGFPKWKLWAWSSVNIPEVKIRLPRFLIRACSSPVQFETEQSRDFLFSKSRPEIGLLSVNSLQESSFVSRGATAFEIA